MALIDFAAEADRCSQCSGCKWIPYDQMKSWQFAKNCPSVAYFNFNAYSARGRYALTRGLLEGEIEITPGVEDVAFSCLTCGACDVACKICRYNLEPGEMVRELKTYVVEQGHGNAVLRSVVDTVERTGNPFGKPRAARGDWAEGLDVPRLPAEKARVLFFAGCMYSYDPELQEVARQSVRILRAAGVDVGILGSREMCCGGRWRGSGYRAEFERMAETNLRAWKAAGVEEIVTSCSDCFHALARLYPPLGSAFKVTHTVDLLSAARHRGQAPLALRGPDDGDLARPVPPRPAGRAVPAVGGRGEEGPRPGRHVRPAQAPRQRRQGRLRPAARPAPGHPGRGARRDGAHP